MLGIIGIIMIFVLVFGGYVSAGGKMEIIMHALPHEMVIIGGATIGAFLVGNSWSVTKQTIKDVGKVFKGPKWKNTDYRDLLALLFLINCKIMEWFLKHTKRSLAAQE